MFMVDHLAAERVSTVMMACKSDGQGDHVQVDPAYANALGETHNIGLIEVTTASTEGRTKMRNGVRWLIHKLEQRASALVFLPIGDMVLMRLRTTSASTCDGSRQTKSTSLCLAWSCFTNTRAHIGGE